MDAQTPLRLIRNDVHLVRVGDRRLLFHIPSTGLFELDDHSAAVLDRLATGGDATFSDIAALAPEFSTAAWAEVVDELVALGAVGYPGAAVRAPSRPRFEDAPLSTLVLNVNTGCNLSCTYCYKEDLARPAAGERLGLDTARKSVELLFENARDRERVSLVFFGGEPLTNLPLIRSVVEYAERRAPEVGKRVDFSLTTNATLLTEPVVDYLDAHRFGITVSIDGPRAVHDRHRKTVGGRGTYELVADRVSMLLGRYRSRPIGARVTLTRGSTDVVGIHHHLCGELGFFEAGFAPATAGDDARFNLLPDELADVFAGLRQLGDEYLAAALRDQNTGFGNLHQLMTDLHHGTSKALPCGAGIGMLAVDHRGELNLCHRFTGSELPTFGDVERGVDRGRLLEFLESASDRGARDCATCRIRNLCAGGCYHESYARYGDPLAPTLHYCGLMRDWVDYGIGVYARISAHNPGFFDKHVEPRRSTP